MLFLSNAPLTSRYMYSVVAWNFWGDYIFMDLADQDAPVIQSPGKVIEFEWLITRDLTEICKKSKVKVNGNLPQIKGILAQHNEMFSVIFWCSHDWPIACTELGTKRSWNWKTCSEIKSVWKLSKELQASWLVLKIRYKRLKGQFAGPRAGP